MLFKRTSCNISPHASKVSLNYRKKRICRKHVVNAQQISRQLGADSRGSSASPSTSVLRVEDASMAGLEGRQFALSQEGAVAVAENR